MLYLAPLDRLSPTIPSPAMVDLSDTCAPTVTTAPSMGSTSTLSNILIHTPLFWLRSIVAGSAFPVSSTVTGTVNTLPPFSTVTVPSVGTGTAGSTTSPFAPVTPWILVPSLATRVTVTPSLLLPSFTTRTVTSFTPIFSSAISPGVTAPFPSTVRTTLSGLYPVAEVRTAKYFAPLSRCNVTYPSPSETPSVSVLTATTASRIPARVAASTTRTFTPPALAPERSISLGVAIPLTSTFTGTVTRSPSCVITVIVPLAGTGTAATLGTCATPLASVLPSYGVPSPSTSVTVAPTTGAPFRFTPNETLRKGYRGNVLYALPSAFTTSS